MTLAWTQLQHTSPRRPAGCWRSQGRLGSTRPGKMTPGAPPSWRQDLGLERGASTLPPHGQQDAGAPKDDWKHTARQYDPGSAAILAAGPWLGRRCLHPPTTRPAGCWRSHGRSSSTRPGKMTLGAPPSWRHDLGLEDGVSTLLQHGQQDAGGPRGADARGGALIPAVGVYLFRRWCVRLCRPSNDGRA